MSSPLLTSWVILSAVVLVLANIFDFFLRRKSKAPAEGIDLNSKCPACGHRGCTLMFLAPGSIQVGEKGHEVTTEPMVKRQCTTCQANSYEKTVLAPSKWIAK